MCPVKLVDTSELGVIDDMLTDRAKGALESWRNGPK